VWAGASAPGCEAQFSRAQSHRHSPRISSADFPRGAYSVTAKAYAERVLLIVAQHDCGHREHMRHLQRDRAVAERACRAV